MTKEKVMTKHRRAEVRAIMGDLLPALRKARELHPEFFDVEVDGFDENATRGAVLPSGMSPFGRRKDRV